jgi:hypothetical protein
VIVAHSLRIVAANVVLALAGAGFLLLIDGWRRLGRWSRLAVALLAGQALFITAAPLLLYARLSVAPLVVLPFIAAVMAAGLIVGRRRRRLLPLPHASEGGGAAGIVGAMVIAAPILVLASRAALEPLYRIDTMLNWVMKAKVLWAGGRQLTGVLDPRLFARPDLHPQSHLEYPLGLSALLAWSFHWMGAADIRVMHLQLVVLALAAVGTSWAILRPLVPDLPLAVGLAGLLMMPAVSEQLLSAYADVPLALIWAAGALVLMRWVVEGERFLLGIATLLLAAALAIKQDGAFYDLAIYCGVATSLVVHHRRRLTELVASAAVVMLTAVPWKVFSLTHHLSRKDIRPGFGRMQAQTDNIQPTLTGIVHVLMNSRATFGAVPLALILAVVCLVRRRRSTQAVPFLVATGVVLTAIVFTYWNSSVTVPIVLIPALPRILMGLVVLAWLLLPPLAFAAIASSETYERTVLSRETVTVH